MKSETWKTTLKTAAERFKKDKRTVLVLIAGLLAGLLFLLPGSTKKEQPAEPQVQDDALQTRLCETLEALIEQMHGAGAAKAMITFEAGEETVYAADKDTSQPVGETDSAKEKTSYVILKNGNSETGLRIKELCPRVRGVAVVCEGGANAVVKAQVIQMVIALFDIKSTQVSVAEMAAKEEPS